MTSDKDDPRSWLLDLIAREGLVEPHLLVPEATLDSLGINSADVVVILMVIEEQFDCYISVDERLSNAKTLDELIAALLPHIAKCTK